MKTEHEIMINTSIDLLMAFSFYKLIHDQVEGFGNLALGMVWTMTVLRFICLFAPEDHWKTLRKKSTAETGYHIAVFVSVIAVCFYIGCFVTGGLYLASWICLESRKLKTT